MAKNTFQQWSTTANNNTDVGGVNIAEGCPPSNINNAIREMMAQLATGVLPEPVYTTKAANYTALAADNGVYFRFTASATLSLTAAATLGANWTCFVYAYSGDVTIDPNASETINGSTTLVIRGGEAMQIICDGTNFYGKLIPSFLFFYTTKSANYTALYTDLNYTLRFTAAATLSLTAAATLGNAWRIRIIAYSGDVVIDPNASETINGATTLTVRSGQSADIVCDGTGFYAIIFGGTWYGQTNSTVSVASSGAFDLTGLPSDLVAFDLSFPVAFGMSAASSIALIQLGSGSVQTTGYQQSIGSITSAPAATSSTATTGISLYSTAATAATFTGTILFRKIGSTNQWNWMGVVMSSNSAAGSFFAGTVTLSGVLDRIRFTSTAGSASMVGSVNIQYQRV